MPVYLLRRDDYCGLREETLLEHDTPFSQAQFRALVDDLIPLALEREVARNGEEHCYRDEAGLWLYKGVLVPHLVSLLVEHHGFREVRPLAQCVILDTQVMRTGISNPALRLLR